MQENISQEVSEQADTTIAFNSQMKKFVLRLIIMVIAWETLYLLYLKAIRIPDAFLTHTLTASVTYFLNLFFDLPTKLTWVVDNYNRADHIQLNGKTILSIFDDCNALDLYLIYLVFLVLLPNTAKRKVKFTFIGIAAIFIGNIIRCMGLYWVYVNYRSSFEFNHHYIFTIMMYLIILVCWIFLTKKSKVGEAG